LYFLGLLRRQHAAGVAGRWSRATFSVLFPCPRGSVLNRLERFRFSCSHAVAAMPDVVRALIGHEESEGGGHQLANVVEGARTHGA
jgi:hypothetical protein